MPQVILVHVTAQSHKALLDLGSPKRSYPYYAHRTAITNQLNILRCLAWQTHELISDRPLCFRCLILSLMVHL